MISCSTALYYYETENITESLLSFRRTVDPCENITYPQNDFRAVETIYGIESEGPSVQEIGSVVTKVHCMIQEKSIAAFTDVH